ncbi:GntR family transcriptional regulator [Desulfobacula sp.]|uniref:GntR family transcriptional regulator n=1 Tax=Desulfobacula sp. TaxID=2593537 RepID=UPI002622E716|nr:GntR family transcriptional regulator [Desulfobacula sp.]
MTDNELKKKVYNSLRLDIVSGKLPAGTNITETTIADTLNVSCEPVRYALQKLSQERLLRSIPQVGYRVEDLSDNEIQDLFTTRSEIEQIAIQRAIEHITVEELQNLRDNIEETKAAIKSGEPSKTTDLDIAFHSIIYRATRSEALFQVCNNLSDLIIKYRHGLNFVPHLMDELIDQHTIIYQALLSKDREKTTQAMEQHAQYTKFQLMAVMKKLRPGTASL